MSTAVTDLRIPRISWRDQVRILIGAAVLGEMPFMEHLEELRKRIIKSLIALASATAIALIYAAPIIGFLGTPADKAGVRRVAIDAMEIFSVYFKVAFSAGICLAAPVILWQTWRFIEPGLHKHEKRYAAPFIISTTLCFAAGAVFGFAIVVPWLLKLQQVMANEAHIVITLSAESYFGMLTTTVIALGAIFEMPPIVFVLSRIGLVNARFLMRNFGYAILLFSIAAALVTPSTTMTPMLLFMAVMTGIYVVSILVAFVFGRTRQAS